MNLDELELLAPAGDLETGKAVIDAGADAVYFGGDLFGARAYAKNFSREEGAELIRYAHLLGRKTYLTVNTLLKNKELEEKLYDYILWYHRAGIDAILVQDIGVMAFLHHYFPDLELHSSTQMTLASSYGAGWLKNLGVKRVVASRELSLTEIKNIHDKTGLQVEAFVHGALCVCYSGQCLMSSMIGGRSGNRGRCAQPCRLAYSVYNASGKPVGLRNSYMLSMKDLCGIDDIPDLYKNGVYSLKIEGRMKQVAYAQGVVDIYRREMDAFLLGDRRYTGGRQVQDKLLALGNRNGFTDVWYRAQNSADMITVKEGAHRHETTEIEMIPPAKRGISGALSARIGKKLEFTVWDDEGHSASVFGPECEPAKNQGAKAEEVKKRLMKTGGTVFLFFDIACDIKGDIFLPNGVLNAIRRDAIAKLEEQILETPKRKELPFSREDLKERTGTEKRISRGKDTALEAVVSFMDQLQAVLESERVDRIFMESELLGAFDPETWDDLKDNVKKNRQALIIKLPLVLRERGASWLSHYREYLFDDAVDGYLASSVDALGFLDENHIDRSRVWLNHRLYTWNDLSVTALSQMGYCHFTAPVELNRQELSHRNNGASSMIVYGHLPLMVTTNCIHMDVEGCDGKKKLMYLEDRKKKKMPVVNHCAFCYNTYLNYLPTSLAEDMDDILSMGMEAVRLEFSVESKESCLEIINVFEKILEGKSAKLPMETTRGHFRRGVE